jgi:hypothetical protein
MRQGLTAAIAAADADPGSSQELPLVPRPRWKRFALIGLAAYLFALLVAMPARLVVDWGPRWQMAGTLWNGEAVLDSAYRLTWRWAPWRSLAAFAFAADVRLDGAGTDITGSAISSGRRLRFDGLSGRGDGALLAALDPALPFTCDAALEVDLPRLIIDGTRSSAVGEVRVGSGTCAVAGANASAVIAPLLATMRAGPGDTTVAELAPVGQARLHLAEGLIAGGRLTVTLTPAGEEALPFARGFRIDETL